MGYHPNTTLEVRTRLWIRGSTIVNLLRTPYPLQCTVFVLKLLPTAISIRSAARRAAGSPVGDPPTQLFSAFPSCLSIQCWPASLNAFLTLSLCCRTISLSFLSVFFSVFFFPRGHSLASPFFTPLLHHNLIVHYWVFGLQERDESVLRLSPTVPFRNIDVDFGE